MTTSIMFCTYNRLNFTKKMLDSFLKNTTTPYRLIIIDNGSSDETPDYLRSLEKDIKSKGREGYFTPFHHDNMNQYCQDIVLHLNDQNKGIAIGRNQGLQAASKHSDEYLCTLDNDIEFPERWLEDCIDVLKANPRFAVGMNFEGTQYPLEVLNGKTVQVKPAGNLGTACTVFPRHLFASIGYFNTEYGLYGEEDADYFFRARLAGYKIGYLPIKGIHFGEGPEDTGPYREFKTKQHALNLAKFQANCYAYMGQRKPIYLPFSQ